LTLFAKADAALELLSEILPRHERPVVLSSFGKDSMVLLDLVERTGRKLPILFFREPHCPKKYLFAERVIRERDYVVYDYPPRYTMVSAAKGVIEIISFYETLPGSLPLYVPTGIKAPVPDQPFLCGLADIYGKPLGSFGFPWDVMLIGHKSSDVDPTLGEIPLNTSYAPSRPAVLLPLRHFTDEDVWTYTKLRHLPVNRLRYAELCGWREFDDITYNPDYFYACTACIDPTQPEEVHCPKTGERIRTAADRVRQLKSPNLPSYIGRTGE
jgi:hypothetical protein